jgi:hypothetical protein
MLKKLAVTIALSLCASAFVVAGISTPAAPVDVVDVNDESAFCPFEVEEDGQKKIITGRCAKSDKGGCANPGAPCGNRRGVCTDVFFKNKKTGTERVQCSCVG